ncbi:phosphoribosyltransferase [Poritiphilus flavus]|uniref:Phosphoribosyltransferase n=1 Tax=Poritiphilus flavus TaxID=2697053 RepID=A0A6L9EBZ2_9FLAO|nr:phosphoribosyltransferase family protein [Poritiphilus flavus]NAS12264.1 phosphoribosyltransferase [Poritiphilus flavus]
MFQDRTDAALQLTKTLRKYEGDEVVVLAIPRGGLPLGNIIAKNLVAPLDVVLTKKIGHPHNREYAIGAVSLQDVVLSDAFGVTKSYIEEETERIRDKLRTRHRQYYKNRQSEDLKDKTILIIDDGIATGNTLLVTIEMVRRQKPKKIVVAVPVAPRETIQKLKDNPQVDEVICLLTPPNFHAVGQFYQKFEQISDQEAIRLLQECQNTNVQQEQ